MESTQDCKVLKKFGLWGWLWTLEGVAEGPNSIPSWISPLSPTIMSWCCFEQPGPHLTSWNGAKWSALLTLLCWQTSQCTALPNKILPASAIQDAGEAGRLNRPTIFTNLCFFLIYAIFYVHGSDMQLFPQGYILFMSQHIHLKMDINAQACSILCTYNVATGTTGNVYKQAGPSACHFHLNRHFYYLCLHQCRNFLLPVFIHTFYKINYKVCNKKPSPRYVWIMVDPFNIHFSSCYVFSLPCFV